MYISIRWLEKAKNYKWFARGYPNADFSMGSAIAMYDYESTGKGFVNHYDTIDGKVNGYALGKHLQDIQLAMWFEDLKRPFMLTKYELLTDPELEPIRKLLIDQLGDLHEDDKDIGQGKPSDSSVATLNKFIGEYMY